MKSIEITFQNLYLFNQALHDVWLEPGSIEFYPKKASLSLLVERNSDADFGDFYDTKQNFLGIFEKQFIPRILSRLHFQGVASYEIRNDSGISRYMFEKCWIDDDLFVIGCVESLVIEIKLAQNGKVFLEDIAVLEKKTTCYRLKKPWLT